MILETHTNPGVVGLIENAGEREIVMRPGQRLWIEKVFDKVPLEPDIPAEFSGTYKRYIVARLIQ